MRSTELAARAAELEALQREVNTLNLTVQDRDSAAEESAELLKWYHQVCAPLS